MISTARNEAYFWPHFIIHYRNHGASHFIILDDNSTDGSLDWLRSQPDVTVYTSTLGFAEPVGKLRFGIAARGLMAQHFCADQWALIADLDEFWVPPPQFATFTQLIASLEANNRKLCRGMMLDCFPEKLTDLKSQPLNTPPHLAAPLFDDIGPMQWPAHESRLERAQIGQNVRMRLVKLLANNGLFSRDEQARRGSPTLYKAPLAKWHPSIRLQSAHVLSGAPYHNDHQLACAHYKFYPGWEDKVAGALETGNYYNGSIEYRMLALVRAHLGDTELRGPATKDFSLIALAEAQLLF